mgnify:CR=1 FL=1
MDDWMAPKMTRTHTDQHGLRPLGENATLPCLSVSVRVVLSPALWLLLVASPLALAAEKEADTPFCRIFDTGTQAKETPSAEVVAKREDWKLVPENNLTHEFDGDAALVNDKLIVLLTTRLGYMHAYSKAADGLRWRATAAIFAPPWAGGDVHVQHAPQRGGPFKIIENAAGAVMVQPVYTTDRKAVVRFRLTTGEPILEIRATQGMGSAQVHTAASYAIVPEFFADDVVLDIPILGSRVCLPVEAQCLHLVDGGGAIVMCAFQAAPPRAMVTGKGPSWFGLASGKSLWLAFLEGKGIWHSRAAGAKDGWKPPFPAKWRCSVAGKDGLAVSYDYEKGPPAGVALPDGPTIIYPIDRTKATPLTTVLPTDVMRNTLGVGPCQYVLQAEGLATEANPTPEQVSHWFEQQFKRKKEKAAQDEIKDRLAQMVEHVGRVQARIGQYGTSAKQLRAVCQKHAGDESASRCLAILEHLDRVAAVKGDEPKAAKQLADATVALIGKENALEECQKLGEGIRAIGSAQDAALARCRLHVRRLRAECASRPDSPLSKELEPLVGGMLQRK